MPSKCHHTWKIGQNAAPVTATYRGSNVEAELVTEVSIESQSAVGAAC
jgi:hypothetical protein